MDELSIIRRTDEETNIHTVTQIHRHRDKETHNIRDKGTERLKNRHTELTR